MKKTIPALAFLIMGCHNGLKITNVSCDLSINKKKNLQIVFKEKPPLSVDELLLAHGDTIYKRIENLGDFAVGDTLIIDWKLLPKTTYSLFYLDAAAKDPEFFDFSKGQFLVDTKADTLIYDYPTDNAKKKFVR